MTDYKTILAAALFASFALSPTCKAAPAETNWKTFNPSQYAREAQLVPNRTALDQHSLIYESGSPSFPYDPTHNAVVYGRGTNSAPTTVFARMGDPVQIMNQVYVASAKPGEAINVKTPGGVTQIWSVTPYTPLSDYSHIANTAQIQPFNPSRAFRSDHATSAWPDVIYANPNEALSISGQPFTAPAAGSATSVSVHDPQGGEHKITIYGLGPASIELARSGATNPNAAAQSTAQQAPTVSKQDNKSNDQNKDGDGDDDDKKNKKNDTKNKLASARPGGPGKPGEGKPGDGKGTLARKAADESVKVEFRSIARGNTSGIADAGNFVIRNQTDWERLWSRHSSIIEPPPKTPNVDFSKQMVIAIFSGQKDTAGFSAKLKNLCLEDKKLIAEVEMSTSARTSLKVKTQPFQIISCKALDEPLNVDWREKDPKKASDTRTK